MIGQTISHYKILEKLGEGGMGVVYKAQDTRLNRIVALKFLPPHLTSTEEERARFVQEGQAAAALNHQNICTIFGIEEFEDRQFIEMEFVDGVTLRHKVPLKKVDEALSCAIQIGDALQEAHSHGIVHRDIKCENIMMNTRGQIKVMDFGLAKLKGSLKLTKTSSTVGTLAYMAPEQIQGGDIDARSDIFSFGVVLFEMLTGHMPFRGEHDAAMMYSIVNEEPESVMKYRQELSPEMDRIIQRALEKDPADRYQHIDDMVSELRRVQKKSTRVVRPEPNVSAPSPGTVERKIPGGKNIVWVGLAGLVVIAVAAWVLFFRSGSPVKTDSQSSKKMLAVLPFENLGSPDQEYFADGITEEITSKLSGLSGLGVIAHSSAMGYKKTTKSIRQIADELGVSYVLQGTVRWEDANGTKRVRVNPQLINVADGTQIWSQPSEAVLAGAFKLQSEIAGQVANALDVTLLQHEKRSLEANFTDNSEAYDYYLRGSEYTHRGYQEKDLRIAVQMFDKAVELDPKFAMAYAQLALLHSDIYWEFYDHTDARVQMTKQAAEAAVRIDPDLPDAHGAMGWYYYHCKLDYENALREFNLALQAQPNNTYLLLGVGSVFRRQGKMDEAFVRFQKAAEIDPRSADFAEETATTLNLMRKFEEADKYFDQAISLAPDAIEAYCDKGFMYLQWKEDPAQAQGVLDEARRQQSDISDPYFIYNEMTVDIFEHKYQEAIDLLNDPRAKVFDFQYWYVPRELAVAEIEGYSGDAEKARENYSHALTDIEGELKNHPQDSRLHSALAHAYAGLGKKDDAVREAEEAVRILPVSKEAVIGAIRLQDLAEVYAQVGETGKSVETIKQLLAIPSLVTIETLKHDPVWNRLRGDQEFQKLLSEK